MNVWRDVDSERRSIGIRVWLQGGEVRIGKHMYRWRWFER